MCSLTLSSTQAHKDAKNIDHLVKGAVLTEGRGGSSHGIRVGLEVKGKWKSHGLRGLALGLGALLGRGGAGATDVLRGTW